MGKNRVLQVGVAALFLVASLAACGREALLTHPMANGGAASPPRGSGGAGGSVVMGTGGGAGSPIVDSRDAAGFPVPDARGAGGAGGSVGFPFIPRLPDGGFAALLGDAGFMFRLPDGGLAGLLGDGGLVLRLPDGGLAAILGDGGIMSRILDAGRDSLLGQVVCGPEARLGARCSTDTPGCILPSLGGACVCLNGIYACPLDPSKGPGDCPRGAVTGGPCMAPLTSCLGGGANACFCGLGTYTCF